MQDDNERLRYNIRRFLIICSMLIFPIMLILLILAEPLFHFLYSSKWDETIPLFQIVCISGLLGPIVSILESILLAKGESSKFLYISIIRKILIVAVILTTYKYGIIYMIIGQIIVRLFDINLLAYYTNRILNYSIGQLIKDLTPYLLIAILIAFSILLEDKVISIILKEIELNEFLDALIRLLLSGCLSQ